MRGTWTLSGMLSLALAWSANAQEAGGLLDLTLEELGSIEVTSVSRRQETRDDAAAAVYVITREQIMSSGVTSLAEALRLAPGVEVARNGAHSWTISMRGFSSNLSNKLLVLIDGRSVYSPLYAGVFWDAQDTLLHDIERIEVIGGPGGAVWGANAVNGVINIITRSAWDTEGGFAEIGVGNENELVAGLRYGGRLGRDAAARAYVKRREHDASRRARQGQGVDDWEMQQAGFRADWAVSETDALTLQGDVYDGEESALVRGDFTLGTLPEEGLQDTVDIAGHNLMATWERQLGHGAALRVKGFYDHTRRDIPGTFREERDTLELDAVHVLRPRGRHELIWGAGARVTEDDVDNTRFATFEPASRRDETYSLFVQDKIALSSRKRDLFLTLGDKLEHNDYTGTEHQPNARLTWLISERQTLWAALSRAVRVPARLNEDLELYAPIDVPGLGVPFYAHVQSRDDFEPEELFAQELGYRIRFGDRVSADLALFRHDYDELQTNEVLGPPVLVPGALPYLVLPMVQGNGMKGETYGGTLDVKWQPLPNWRLEFQLSHIDFDLELRSGSRDRPALDVAGNSPEYQGAVYSYLSLSRNLSLFTGVRYVDGLPNQGVPSYTELDLAVDWWVSRRLKASVAAHNLADPHHPEFGGGNEIERSIVMKLDWRF